MKKLITEKNVSEIIAQGQKTICANEDTMFTPSAKDILKAVGKGSGVRIVSCPTCGRTKIDLISLAKQVEDATRNINKDISYQGGTAFIF